MLLTRSSAVVPQTDRVLAAVPLDELREEAITTPVLKAGRLSGLFFAERPHLIHNRTAGSFAAHLLSDISRQAEVNPLAYP